MDDKEQEDIHTYVNRIGAGVMGNILYDINSNTVSVYDGTSYTLAASNAFTPEPYTLQIKEGNVKIGNLVMDVDDFETCLRHLLKITKEAKPEEFI